MSWQTVANFFVPGCPRPGGSKTAKVVRRKGGEIVMVNGRPLITTRDDAKGNATWKQDVKVFARQAWGNRPLLCSRLLVDITFYMPRLAGHFGTGRNAGVLKATAPEAPTVKPDVLKLARSTEDALTDIVWRDDAATTDLSIRKRYGDKPGAEITISVWVERTHTVPFKHSEASAQPPRGRNPGGAASSGHTTTVGATAEVGARDLGLFVGAKGGPAR